VYGSVESPENSARGDQLEAGGDQGESAVVEEDVDLDMQTAALEDYAIHPPFNERMNGDGLDL